MANLPFMQFYPADWLRDCQILTLAARGAWQTIICKAWHPSTRGVVTMKLAALSRLLSCTVEQTERVIAELQEAEIGDISREGEYITITCRRTVRDWAKMESKKASLSKAGRLGMEKRWGLGGYNHLNKVAITSQKPEARSHSTNHIAPPSGDAAGDASSDRFESGERLSLPMPDIAPDGDSINAGARSVGNACNDACGVKPPPKIEKKPRPRNLIFDALAEATDGHPDKLTKSAAGAVGTAAADIKRASPDVTPDEVRQRAENYRLHFPTVTLTASALAKHWARCESPPPPVDWKGRPIVQRKEPDAIPEPDGWRAVIAHSKYGPGGLFEVNSWMQLSRDMQEFILQELANLNK